MTGKSFAVVQQYTALGDSLLSNSDIVSYNWYSLFVAFLQSTHSVVEKIMFLKVLQPAICHAYNILVISKFAFLSH